MERFQQMGSKMMPKIPSSSRQQTNITGVTPGLLRHLQKKGSPSKYDKIISWHKILIKSTAHTFSVGAAADMIHTEATHVSATS